MVDFFKEEEVDKYVLDTALVLGIEGINEEIERIRRILILIETDQKSPNIQGRRKKFTYVFKALLTARESIRNTQYHNPERYQSNRNIVMYMETLLEQQDSYQCGCQNGQSRPESIGHCQPLLLERLAQEIPDNRVEQHPPEEELRIIQTLFETGHSKSLEHHNQQNIENNSRDPHLK